MKLQALNDLLDLEGEGQIVIKSQDKRRVEAQRIGFLSARNKLPGQLQMMIRIQRLAPLSEFNPSEKWVLIIEKVMDDEELGMVRLPDGSELTLRELNIRNRINRANRESREDDNE